MAKTQKGQTKRSQTKRGLIRDGKLLSLSRNAFHFSKVVIHSSKPSVLSCFFIRVCFVSPERLKSHISQPHTGIRLSRQLNFFFKKKFDFVNDCFVKESEGLLITILAVYLYPAFLILYRKVLTETSLTKNHN